MYETGILYRIGKNKKRYSDVISLKLKTLESKMNIKKYTEYIPIEQNHLIIKGMIYYYTQCANFEFAHKQS